MIAQVDIHEQLSEAKTLVQQQAFQIRRLKRMLKRERAIVDCLYELNGDLQSLLDRKEQMETHREPQTLRQEISHAS